MVTIAFSQSKPLLLVFDQRFEGFEGAGNVTAAATVRLSDCAEMYVRWRLVKSQLNYEGKTPNYEPTITRNHPA